MTRIVSPFGSARGIHFGKTSFENHELNQMIDIVESASPELLESAGTALVAARDAINDAANELSRNLGDVDWEGEAHTAFYNWGTDLVTTALSLASYTDVVGTQVMAASSGLASVRKSMPPRDNRTDPKTVDDIPVVKQVDTNDEYTAAVKAESHRQEAINQMYRLASFYTVSSGTMQSAEEPVFPKMPSVGVPAPAPDRGLDIGAPIQGSLASVSDSESTGHRSAGSDPAVVRASAGELPSSNKPAYEAVASPERHVGTEIDSVGTLPPQETMKPTPVTSPSTTPNVTPVGTAPPFVPVAAPPAARGQIGRTSGFGGVSATRTPTSAQGRAGGTSAGRTGTGGTGPLGRAAASGQAGGRAPGAAGRGVVGGVPRAAGTAAGKAGGVPRGPVTGNGATSPGRTGAGRGGIGRTTDGVVGGKPVKGATPGANGSRVPRGTVIGGQNAPASRATGERPGQRGVIKAPGSTAASEQTPRRPVGSPGGVVGAPKERASGPRNGGHTPGGIGVTRGSVSDKGPGKTRARRDERRDGASSTD
ncbi:WXG100 family type VII secretion target [Streptomyces sp. NPDC003247]|uniref:WXG100 family type VII secretion target n=1 Tax=Streptomyces sp. NPDC003247 TaxID=3364677 RepID=UPI0036A72E69